MQPKFNVGDVIKPPDRHPSQFHYYIVINIENCYHLQRINTDRIYKDCEFKIIDEYYVLDRDYTKKMLWNKEISEIVNT